MIQNKNGKIKILVITLVISAVIIASIILIGNRMNANIIKEKQDAGQYQDWLSQNCKCIERNNPACELSGFEYNATRKLCVNSADKRVTYSTLKCSKYDCSGQNVTWNNQAWEPKING